ncbi:MAG TPA: two-component sensor histidine kinase, partial [Actinotalea sp.]|nr:two-component sensor histidine kinase [Actinotalea sp.]
MSRTVGLPRTATALGGLAWVLAALGLALHAASGVGFGNADVLFLLVDAAVAGVYGAVGAVVLARRRHPVGWLVLLAAIGGGLSATGGGWGAYAATHP